MQLCHQGLIYTKSRFHVFKKIYLEQGYSPLYVLEKDSRKYNKISVLCEGVGFNN